MDNFTPGEFEKSPEQYENERGYNEESSNIITGTVGAALGSLIGVALWIFLFQLDYIASISGIVMVICALKGYELFGKVLDKKGVIVTLIVTIIMVYVANHLSFGYMVYSEFKADGATLIDGISSVGDLIGEFAELKSLYVKNLLIGYAFTILGTFSMFKRGLRR